MTANLDINEVRAALQTRAVLEFYGWTFKRSGDEIESTACPTRADHSRRAFVINANSGRWQCFPCGTSGDLFDFIAHGERLAIPADFPAVLTKAAEIAGVGPSTLSNDERKQRNEEWKRRQVEVEQRAEEDKRARDEAAVPIATAYWNELEAKNTRGFEYLCSRRVGDAILTDTVRFDPKHEGSPAVALHSSNGAIRNVVARRFPELGDPKTPGLYRCPGEGTLVNAISQIERDRDVVFTEGVMDSITARLAWRSAIILGAHGADNLPKVARQAMPFIAKAKTRLLIVAHRDQRGYQAAVAACKCAIDAGLSLRRGTLKIVKHGEKDLNDAWKLGWRPSA